MTEMRDYLSGNGSNPLSRVADHTLVKLLARAFVLLAPVAVTMIYSDIVHVKAMQHELAKNMAVTVERVSQHERQLGELRVSVQDRYTAGQASGDQRRVEKILDDIRARLRALEQRERG